MKKIITIFILLLSTAPYSEASVVYVNSSNTPIVQNGQSWATAYAKLEAGIDAANAGDSVWVAAGAYVASTGPFSMKTDVKVYGGFSGSETQFADRNLTTNIATLTQAHGGPVITCWGNLITNTTVVDGLTVTAAFSAAGQRAIFNYLSSPTFSNCTIKNSVMGGMSNEYASPLIINCVFLNNTVSPTGPGGALYNTNSNATIINCSFIGNNVSQGSNGSGGNGGAIYNYSSNVTIKNCLFWKNRATGTANMGSPGGLGGAVFNIFSSPSIINCTFYGNSANGLGTALNNNTGSNAPILRNSIFWGNYKFGNLSGGTSDPIDGISAGPNFSYNLIQGQPASSFYQNLDGSVNPQFIDTLNGNFQLAATSPCINAGLNSVNTSVTDLAGNARIQNTVIDLGPLESSFGTPLPLEVFGFTGRMQDNQILLKWHFTGTQSASTAIEVQRSPDGNDESFKVLGVVSTRAGKEEYDFLDKEPLTMNFYRLRIRDEQNQRWSRIIMLSADKPQLASRLYPNPAGSKITLYVANPALMHTSAFLLSSTGAIMKTITLENYTQIVDLEAVAPGVYFLKLKDDTMLKLIKK